MILLVTNFYALVHLLLTKTTVAQNEVALCYDRVRGPYFLAVVFVSTIVVIITVPLHMFYVMLMHYIVHIIYFT